MLALIINHFSAKRKGFWMKKLFLIITLFYINFTTCKTTVQAGQIAEPQTVVKTSTPDEEEELFVYAPVKFSPEGMQRFFNNKFNHSKYATDFLPHNLVDVIDFLKFGKATSQNRKYFRSVLKIFNQQFKKVEYLSAQEFTKLIVALPELIEGSIEPKVESDTKVKVKNLLYTEFLNYYNQFKEDPDKFFVNLAEKIHVVVGKKEDSPYDDLPVYELRTMLLRFIESGTNKLVWFIEDEPDIWTQFKQTCDSIYLLKDRNLVPDIFDINDLIYGALARFQLILEVRGSNLPVEFFDKTLEDILNNAPVWLNLEEQDELIESKKDSLIKIVKKARISAFARQKFGILPKNAI